MERNKILASQYLEQILSLIKIEKIHNFTDFQRSLFDSETHKVKINLGSSKQVIELCKALNIPTKVKDLKKSRESSQDVYKDSVEERILKQYVGLHPIIQPYLSYKRVEKAVSTYGEKFLEKHHNPVTGAIHTSFWQLVDTGRLASQSPNIQNIPSKRKLPGYRECFVPRGTNRKLIVADYSSQEARILADKSQDEALIHFFKEGDGDFHSHTARLMFDLPSDQKVDDLRRALAKTINFGIVFGMSEFKLSKDFDISIEEAKDFIERFYRSYCRLEPYFRTLHKYSFNNGYVLTDRFTRRKSFFGPVWEEWKQLQTLVTSLRGKSRVDSVNMDWKRFYVVKGIIERASQNYGIQGQAASMTKLALVLFKFYTKQEKLDAYLVACVHDEIVVEAHEKDSLKAGQLLKKAMLFSGSIFCRDVEMASDQKIGDTWDH